MHKNEPSCHRAHSTDSTLIIAKRFHPRHFIALCLLTCAYMLTGCTLEDPSYGEYVDNNGEYLTCKNISAIMFNDATITQDNPIYQGKDYSPAFKFHMCPNAAPNCIADTAQTNMCATGCSNLCYGECVAEYRDINIASCEHPDGKTITCIEGFADCDGNITNGCEYNLTANNVSDCQWDAPTASAKWFCKDGWADCDNNPVNGCEYDLETNHALSCQNQQVTCLDDAVYSDCDGNYKNGCEYEMAGKNITSCQHRQVLCQTGFGDCDGSYNNGCETDLLSSLIHCGGCTTYTVDSDGTKTPLENHTCPSGTVCDGQGFCADTCMEGSISCGGACINIASSHIDVQAGGCENTLDEDNNIISTMVRCVANYANCDDDPQNGCEFGLLTNNATACENQNVICQNDFANCDGNYENGCEYNLLASHARACTRTENEDGTISVTLTCDEDYVDCDGNYENGCEYQLSFHNAEACQRIVDEGTGETSVRLTCKSGLTDCDGDYTNGCEYILDMNHVSSCIYNSEYCSQNDCDNKELPHIKKRGLITCTPPYADVDKDYTTGCEVDGTYNANHCGARGAADNDDPNSENYKGMACEGGQVCQAGVCGFTCDEQNGYNLCPYTDPETGIVSGQCLNFDILHLKSCERCADTYCDMNGSILNGCEIDMQMMHNVLGGEVLKILDEPTLKIIQMFVRMQGIDETTLPAPLIVDGCFICPGGYIPNTDRTLCTLCPAGHYSQPGSLCFACPPGTYLYNNSCYPCEAGTYSGEAATACTSCPAGTYAPTLNSYTCTPCPANTWSNTKASSCQLCAAGTFSNPGSTNCSACPDGSVSTSGGACYPCKAGYYANADHTACLICPADTISTVDGEPCSACPEGQTNNNDHTECIDKP